LSPLNKHLSLYFLIMWGRVDSNNTRHNFSSCLKFLIYIYKHFDCCITSFIFSPQKHFFWFTFGSFFISIFCEATQDFGKHHSCQFFLTLLILKVFSESLRERVRAVISSLLSRCASQYSQVPKISRPGTTCNNFGYLFKQELERERD
jgi:hypothetical protein